jgi:uncharacterized protein (TIRG00374 family)
MDSEAYGLMTTTTPARKKRWVLVPIKVVASAGLLYWVLHGTDLREVKSAIAAADVPLLFMALSVYWVTYLLSMSRWAVLLSAQGVPVQKRKLVHAYLVATYFSNFLPSTMGGDAYRAYESWRWGTSKSGALAVVFVDRFLGLVALVLFALGAAVVWHSITVLLHLPTWTIAVAAAGMLFVVWGIFFTPDVPLGRELERMHAPGSKIIAGMIGRVKAAFQSFRGRRDTLGKAMLLSLALQVAVVVYYYVLAKALGFDVSLPPFFLIVPLSVVAMLIPISINGIGVREYTFVFLFALFGVARADSVALALVDYGVVLLQGGVGAVAYALGES